MVDEIEQTYESRYCEYLKRLGFSLRDSMHEAIAQIVVNTDWDTPSTAQEWNNIGVFALIQAEECDEISLKEVFWEVAREAFESGAEGFPLCKAHSILLEILVGNFTGAKRGAFNALIQMQLLLNQNEDNTPLGLIYFPPSSCNRLLDRTGLLELLFLSEDGVRQAYHWFGQVFAQAAQVFYNPFGLRTLTIASQINTTLPLNLLRYGLSCLMNQQTEGLIYLHGANRLAPKNFTVLQSLYLAYRDLGQLEIAQHYWQQARSSAEPQNPEKTWTTVESDAAFTYLPFEKGQIILTAQPSLKSIVTSVLLADGDWFESEMEFWRHWVKPGMTVIDVGANAGVYTFSAATRVGAKGKVIAIEPFPDCVNYLKETCRYNQFDWVHVYDAAASDRAGSIKLSIHGASELNEVIADEAVPITPGQWIEIPCLKLDSLIENEALHSVDVIKLDAEGHEINVLKGCQQIINQFLPVILYENIAAGQSNNLEVAEFLIQKEYRLHIYKPYLNQLIPLTSMDELDGQLNVIAIPKAQY